MDKESLRKRDRFFLVDPKTLVSFEEWAEYLESILHGSCSAMEIDGRLELLYIKRLVASVRGMKIEIFSKEHPPPHFHVTSSSVDASFTIDDCKLINGKINGGDLNKIVYWHSQGAKNVLIDYWNSFRPSNCVVGPYKE